MKNIFIILFLGILLVMPLVIAQEIETNPGITPDIPIIYQIDRALERIRMALTFGDENKVNYGLKIAEERIAEIKIMQEGNKTIALERARIGYEDSISEIENKTVSNEVKLRVRERLQIHTMELNKVLINSQEQSREGLQNAIEKSGKVREQFKR